ncbi:MAG: DUF1018 domain-containing protein [Alphaproteobacteria bacterium]|nr:DUF1018 domain-containing protein [Alphaproteobacteria bacterium]
MAEDSYRAMLQRITGRSSCSAMTLKQLEDVVAEFKRLGFKPKPPKRAGQRKQADGAQATMIRALWLDLHNLGAVADPSEEALNAFVKRSCKVPALQWIDPYQADRVIKALRGWLERIGFAAPDADMVKRIAWLRHRQGCDDGHHFDTAIAWKIAVIKHQFVLLEMEEYEDDPLFIAADNLDQVIAAFGRSIRVMLDARERA